MAERAFTVGIPVDDKGSNVMGALIVTWTGLLNGDTGKPFVCPHRADKSVQVTGTFGTGGNCRIQGTNAQVYDTVPAAVSATWATLADPQGNALDVTAAKVEQLLENTNAVRPNITAGDGTTSLTVTLLISSAARL